MNPRTSFLLLLISLIPLGLASWQDIRTRHVSNWITVPLFFLAWPLAWWLHGWHGVAVTGVTFIATYLAMPFGFGAADGKLAVYLAALGGIPLVLLAFLMLLMIFLAARLFPGLAERLVILHEEDDGRHVAGVPGYFLADVAFSLLFFLLEMI